MLDIGSGCHYGVLVTVTHQTKNQRDKMKVIYVETFQHGQTKAHAHFTTQSDAWDYMHTFELEPGQSHCLFVDGAMKARRKHGQKHASHFATDC